MSSFAGLYLMSQRMLRWFSFGMGSLLIALAALLRFATALKEGETYLVLLMPLIYGVAMIVAGLVLKSKERLIAFYVGLFVVVPGLLYSISWVLCGLEIASRTWCS